jgi:DNA-binding transcriptional LysR family regulator
VLAPALAGWRSRYPQLQISTVEAEEDELSRAMRAGAIDAVVVELDAGEAGYSPPRGTTDIPLLDEPWKLVLPEGMLISADVVDLERLALPWLHVDPSAASARAIERVRRLLGGEVSTLHTYYSFQTALALVAAREGVSLVPSLALEGLSTEGVETMDIPGLGMRRIALRTLTRSRSASPALATVIGLIREASASFSYELSGD